MTLESVNSGLDRIVRGQALSEAARILAEARARRDAMTVREAALAAHVPGGPSIDELAALIQAQRDRARARAASTTAA